MFLIVWDCVMINYVSIYEAASVKELPSLMSCSSTVGSEKTVLSMTTTRLIV